MINKHLHTVVEAYLINHLLINTSFLPDPGLMNGKMGVCLILLTYNQHKNHPVLRQYVYRLIDELIEEYAQGSDLSYATGICGFGSGIEYLDNHGLIHPSAADIILSDSDEYIYDVGNLEDGSNIIDICRYFLSRSLSYPSKNKRVIIENNKRLIDTFSRAKYFVKFHQIKEIIDFLAIMRNPILKSRVTDSDFNELIIILFDALKLDDAIYRLDETTLLKLLKTLFHLKTLNLSTYSPLLRKIITHYAFQADHPTSRWGPHHGELNYLLYLITDEVVFLRRSRAAGNYNKNIDNVSVLNYSYGFKSGLAGIAMSCLDLNDKERTGLYDILI